MGKAGPELLFRIREGPSSLGVTIGVEARGRIHWSLEVEGFSVDREGGSMIGCVITEW